jgi:hypothetical protein
MRPGGPGGAGGGRGFRGTAENAKVRGGRAEFAGGQQREPNRPLAACVRPAPTNDGFCAAACVAAPHGRQTKLCTRWMSGDCRFGDRCNFAHGEHELRSLPPRGGYGGGGPPRGGYGGGGMPYGGGRGGGRVSWGAGGRARRPVERRGVCVVGGRERVCEKRGTAGVAGVAQPL